MKLLPHDNETFVVSLKAADLELLLTEATLQSNLVQDEEEHAAKQFVGWVKAGKFEFSIRPKRPNSFIPMMVGEIESASSGSILFISYSLFPSTQLYLAFWSLFVAIAGIVAFFQLRGDYIPFVTVIIIAAIHYVAWANFKMQVRVSRDILMQALSQ